MNRPTLVRRLRRFTYFRRRTLAALAAGLAVLAALRVLAPPTPATVTIVAAARELPGGTTLAADDLTTVDLPSEAVPDGAFTSADAAIGRMLSGPLAARGAVTEIAVATGQALASPGNVVVTLPLADDTLRSLVQPGVHLDLINLSDGSLLARDVRVVAVPESADQGFMSTTDKAALVEVTPDVAAQLAVASQAGGVAIALR